ncbi:MAG: hypothetical protein ACXWQO_12810 [Bdellovibrionota bacterium]
MRTKLAVLLIGAGFCAGAFFLAEDSSSILIESRESKTILGKPVFNRIRKIAAPGKTIYMMNQSHDGVNAAPEKWERLAIVIDHASKTAEYFQLESGALEWDPNAKQTPLRVACFLCHANGPRGIRPNFHSAEAKISLKNTLRIALWNLVTKTAGRIEASPNEALKDATLRHGQNPFRYRGVIENQTLQVKTCLHCHSNSGFLARGLLTKQNFMAIGFMVKNKEMPPPGFSLSTGERAQVLKFIGE